MKLPIRVAMQGNKMTLLDGDLASSHPMMKQKRQDVAMQAIKLLINPRTEELTTQRCQILTLIVLNKLLNEYGFKDPNDSFKVGPDDRVTFKSDQVIKMYRPDLALEARANRKQAMLGPSAKTEKATKEMEVKRFLQSLETVGGPDVQQRKPGPKSKTRQLRVTSPDPHMTMFNGLERRVDHERRLFSAANWNAKHASDLFQTLILNPQNVMMNVFYLPDYAMHNTVAFVPAMSVDSGSVCQIPFLIDLPPGQSASKAVASAAIVGFEFGVTVSNPHNVARVKCVLCDSNYPTSYMETHLKSEHSLEEDPSLGPPAKMAGNQRVPKGPFDDVRLWSVIVDQDKLARFGNPRNLVLNLVPITGNVRQMSQLDTPLVKEEPKEGGKKRPVARRKHLDFRCRYCPRRFTTTRGWDAHLDSRHSEKQPFLCPFEGCVECFANKSGVLQHMEFSCKKFRTEGKIRELDKEPTAAVVPNLSKLKPAPKVAKRVSSEPMPPMPFQKIQKNEAAPSKKIQKNEPTSLKKIQNNGSTPSKKIQKNNTTPSKTEVKPSEIMAEDAKKVAKSCEMKKTKKRKSTFKATPKITDGDLNKSDEIEDIAAANTSSGSITINTEEEEELGEVSPGSKAEETSKAAASAKKVFPRRSNEDSAKLDELRPKPESESMAKRRKRHPQIAFTAIMKDVIIGCAGFIKDQTKLIRKQGALKSKMKVLNLRPIEDKVDRDYYQTREMLLEDFKALCNTSVTAENSEDAPIYKNLKHDMIRNCEEEVALRDAELASLETQINPMLSDDKNVSFRHCLIKILEEEVRTLRISHSFASRVNKAVIPDYYKIVKDPICIDDIVTAVQYGEYKNKNDFINAFKKMQRNSVAYNGKNDQLSKDALTILNLVKVSLKKFHKYVID
jgi:hypothetical protein